MRQRKIDKASETVDIENKEVDVNIKDQQQVAMDVNEKLDDNINAKDSDQKKAEGNHSKKLVVLLEQYLEVENNKKDENSA